MLDRYFTLEDPTRLEPAERELYVESLLESRLLLRGFVDRLDVSPDGRLRVVDYKTGRSPGPLFEAKALFQMKFYALVIWRNRGVVPTVLQLVYLGNAELLRYEPDEQDLLATERKVVAIWQAIRQAEETGDWRPNPGRMCDWCSHQAICPAWGGTPPPLPERPASAPDPAGDLGHRRGRHRARLARASVVRGQIPWRSAHRAAWVRSVTPIRANTEVRCALTVRSLMPSRRAICLLASPWRHEPQHLGLPRGEVRGHRRTAPGTGGEQLTGRAWVDRRLAAADGPDPGEDLVGVGVLEQVAHGAGVQGAHDALPVGERRQDEHLRELLGHDLAGGAHAVDPGHLEVHEHDVGPQGARLLDGLGAVGGLADDGDVVDAGEELGQAAPHHGVVVDQQHGDHCSDTSSRTVVPSPGFESTVSLAPASATRLVSPRKP